MPTVIFVDRYGAPLPPAVVAIRREWAIASVSTKDPIPPRQSTGSVTKPCKRVMETLGREG